MSTNPLTDLLRHHVTGAIERGEGEPIVAMELTNAQADRLAAAREYWDGVTGYMMPADHRHSPGMLILSLEKRHTWEPGYVQCVVRVHPDGRREAINDDMNALHFLTDARTEGRRI